MGLPCAQPSKSTPSYIKEKDYIRLAGRASLAASVGFHAAMALITMQSGLSVRMLPEPARIAVSFVITSPETFPPEVVGSVKVDPAAESEVEFAVHDFPSLPDPVAAVEAIKRTEVPAKSAEVASAKKAIKKMELPAKSAEVASAKKAIKKTELPAKSAEVAPAKKAIKKMELPAKSAEVASAKKAIKKMELPAKSAEVASAKKAIKKMELPAKSAEVASAKRADASLKSNAGNTENKAEVPANASPAPSYAPATAKPTAERPTETTPSFSADYLHNLPPSYPKDARRRGIEGVVLLDVTVTADGRPATIEIYRSSGSGVLDAAARSAVARWTFVPARRGDVPVLARVRVPIEFRLH